MHLCHLGFWIKDRVVPISLNQVTTIIEPLGNLADMYVKIYYLLYKQEKIVPGDVSKHHALNL